MQSVHDFLQAKKLGKKITMVTCYDYTSARIVSTTEIDCILIGDSSAMVMQGYAHTTQATVMSMAGYTESVARGASNKFLIADLPFMSYRKSLSETITAVEKLVRAGAQAIKLEGALGNCEMIRHIVESGIPVMGHLGLMPQQIHGLGGFKVQGRNEHTRLELLQHAKMLEEAGCFSIVLECVPMSVAADITASLDIPTIGIGAGPETDGQVLVFQDLLGLQDILQPKFVKTYLNGAELFRNSINQYVTEVRSKTFPTMAHTYGAKNNENYQTKNDVTNRKKETCALDNSGTSSNDGSLA